MPVLLVSTYDLGRQPFGLASPAAWLRRSGVDVECVDASRDTLEDDQIARATLVAFYLPMHTATRLASPLITRVRQVNPSADVCAFGLYGPLNDQWLRDHGVKHVLGPEAEADLVRLASGHAPAPKSSEQMPRLALIQPSRVGLPPLARYASLQMPDGSRRVIGSTESSRGCKHLCRHCPIVPVYGGQFRVVPVDVVLSDIRAHVQAGAQHISFGDPDFLNGPTHARRVVAALAHEFPNVSYDATIKVEHLLQHRAMLDVLRDTGCLFITSAVESIDDDVLRKLRKGHTREDVRHAVELCRQAGVTLTPTFVPFTPWTTLAAYVELLDFIEAQGLVEQVAPIQLAIRLLVTSGSALLELAGIRNLVAPFDPASLTYPWRHEHPGVDALQQEVLALVSSRLDAPRGALFDEIVSLARNAAGLPRQAPTTRTATPVPVVSEPWYCCAEPQQLGAV